MQLTVYIFSVTYKDCAHQPIHGTPVVGSASARTEEMETYASYFIFDFVKVFSNFRAFIC